MSEEKSEPGGRNATNEVSKVEGLREKTGKITERQYVAEDDSKELESRRTPSVTQSHSRLFVSSPLWSRPCFFSHAKKSGSISTKVGAWST